MAEHRIAFWGTSDFVGAVSTARILRSLLRSGIRPAAVITAPDPADGTDAVKRAALEVGIRVLQPAALKNFLPEFLAAGIDLSLVAAYGKILPAELLSAPRFGSLNIHPSLLPRWRGPTPIQAAILSGDAKTGVTVIEMDEQMDHGPIVAAREFDLRGRNWTGPELSDALSDLGAEAVSEVLNPWIAGRITPEPQRHKDATYSRILKKEDGHVRWEQSANEIERMVRAYRPWPGSYSIWTAGGGVVRLSIEAARVQCGFPGAAPGTVFSDGGSFSVAAGEGSLEIIRVTPSGSKIMRGEDFMRGHGTIIGHILK